MLNSGCAVRPPIILVQARKNEDQIKVKHYELQPTV